MAKETILIGFWQTAVTSLNNMFTELYGNITSYFTKITTTIPVTLVPVAVGRELNIYRDALSVHFDRDSTKYIAFMGAVGAYGKNMNHGFRYTPVVGEIGDHTLNLYHYDYNRTETLIKALNIKVIANNGGTGTKQILNVGDSLTSAGITVTEMRDLIVADGGTQAVFLGTAGSTVKHEGYSGWDWATHIGATSPFYSVALGRIDFADYMSKNGFTGNIDHCYIQLGLNDVGQAQRGTPNYTTIINNAITFISQLLSNYPNCKIVLELEPFGCDDDGCAASNNYPYYSIEFVKQKMLGLYNAYVTEFTKATYTNKVFISANYMWIDRRWGYPYAYEAVCAREITTVMRNTNGIHPNTQGYKQLADARYSWFRYLNTL